MKSPVKAVLGKTVRVAILSGTALWATVAYAQDQNGGSLPAASPTAPAAGIPAVGTADSSGDIIVTAQRRTERLRDVPISITAVAGETLVKQGITNITDLPRVAPGLSVPTYGNFVQFSIRGISSTGAGLGDSSNIALYVDGVYQSSEQTDLQDLPDVSDIQVLKGPQGTLYGQNAAGGAVIVNTYAPSFTTKGRMTASYGNYNDKDFNGYVTTPLSDTIAVLISGAYEQRDGFRHDLINGGHDEGLRSALIRGKILFKPSSDISFTLGAFYSKRSDTNPFTGIPLNNNSIGYGLADEYGLNIPRGTPRSFAENVPVDGHLEMYGVNLNGKIDTGIGTINTVTAYYHNSYLSIQDVDFSAVNYGNVYLPITGHTFIQEVNMVSKPIGPLTLTGGLFFMHKQEAYAGSEGQLYNVNYFGGAPTVAPTSPVTLLQIGGPSDTAKNSYAAYLEGEYKITDHLILTAGGRYSYERQRYSAENLYNVGCGCFVPYQALANSPVSFRKFTPHATLRYRFNDGTNIYASYSQGFKSGFLDATNVNAKPVQPEEVTAYEVGYKGRPLPGVSLNLAGFHYDYKKIQVFIYDPNGPNGSYYQNAASAQIDGIDADTTIKLTRELTFSGGVSWLIRARYKKYPDAADLAPIYVPAIYNPQPGDTFGNANVVINANGKWMIRAPKVQVTASLSYLTHLASGDLDAYVSANYNSGFKYDPAGYVRQPHYATIDAEVGFAPNALKGVRFVLWGRNLTDKNYFASELNSTVGNTVAYAAPRTFGGRVEFEF